MKFAKLYEDAEYGQILVKRDNSDEEEVRFYFVPDNLGVCSIALKYGKDIHAADEKFEAIDNDGAVRIVDCALKELGVAHFRIGR